MPIVTTPSSTLLRQLFPSWEFFDVARLSPTLQLRRLPSGAEPGAWLGVVRPAPRRWWQLFFNPAGTQTLAAQTLVERWYTELIEQGEDAPACRESFAVITALAEGTLAGRAVGPLTERGGWQLRLVVIDEEAHTMEVVFESGRMAVRGLPVKK